LHASFVLTKANRRHEIHEGRRIRAGHVVTDRRRIVRRVLLIGIPEQERQLHGLIRQCRPGLKLNIDVRFGSLFKADGAIRPEHAVIPQHHGVLDHAQPFRFRVPAGSRWVFLPLESRSLFDVGARPLKPALLVVP